MGSPVLNIAATIKCSHTGQAQAMQSYSRVLVCNQPVVTQASSHTVSACTLPAPPAGNGPCISAQWTQGAARVFAGGTPVLLSTSSSLCTPTGTPLIVQQTQNRVLAK